MTTWTVTPTPGGRWTEEFWLPVDAGFVGLRGTAEVERSIAAIRIEAVDIIDEGARTATPPVLAASAYGDTLAFFHEERMYPEPGGFWTTGRRPARVTLACANNCAAGVVLRVHSGARPNHLRLATHGWSQEIELTGGTEVDIQVPPPATGNTILLELETTTGFVPMEVDPSLRDERYLGVWVAPMPSARETP
jgi:hypothetical protein